jgi:hypothetical protein
MLVLLRKQPRRSFGRRSTCYRRIGHKLDTIIPEAGQAAAEGILLRPCGASFLPSSLDDFPVGGVADRSVIELTRPGGTGGTEVGMPSLRPVTSIVVGSLFLFAPVSVRAATITVTSTADDGQGVSTDPSPRDGDREPGDPTGVRSRDLLPRRPPVPGDVPVPGCVLPASVEVDEVVIATSTMSLAEYLACQRFELSVEIFYNDLYLEEIHGLARALGLSMFEFVERCHARLPAFRPSSPRTTMSRRARSAPSVPSCRTRSSARARSSTPARIQG